MLKKGNNIKASSRAETKSFGKKIATHHCSISFETEKSAFSLVKKGQ